MPHKEPLFYDRLSMLTLVAAAGYQMYEEAECKGFLH